MKLALIGLGAAGRGHLALLAKMPEIELAGIGDLDPIVTERLGREYGVPIATTETQRLIEDPAIEAIAIAAADRAHYPLVMACAAAGKHVICEKPLATRTDHGRAMVEAMQRAGKVFCISFQLRYADFAQRIKSLVEAGAVGHVRMVRLVGLMAAPDNPKIRENIGDEAAQARAQGICVEGRNALFDCGVHSFDYARYLTGRDYRRVDAMGYAMRGFPHPDHGVALCEMDNGIFVMVEKSFVYAFEAQTYKEYTRYEVIGDEGSLAWDLDTQDLKLYSRTQTLLEHLPHGGKENSRTLVYRRFAESVAQGQLLPPLASGEDGQKAGEAAQAALDAMLAKGVVQRDVGKVTNWFET